MVYWSAWPLVGEKPVQNGTPANPFTVVAPPVAVLVTSPVRAENVPCPIAVGTPLMHTYSRVFGHPAKNTGNAPEHVLGGVE